MAKGDGWETQTETHIVGRSRLTPLAERQKRRQSVDVERKLWYLLRGRQMGGHRFKRQHDVGPFVADFCCTESRLIVEIGAAQEALGRTQAQQRALALKRMGYKVLRFHDEQILNQTRDVIDRILRGLKVSPSSPSLQKQKN
ncbi:MAG: DUF559 domain-containing protein [Elusimicrobia bacterium]|nr:DUF559 domain-containing protein [Elusimicrobiota bacterium]